jgi:transposase-like protein
MAEVTAKHTPRKRRARLTPDEHRQIVGLYSDPQVSTAEIRQRFAITDTSLYRLLQKQGVPLRGRTTSRPARAGSGSRPDRSRAGIARRGQPRRAASVAASPDGRATREFRIEFHAERIVVADNVRDALQQAVLAGATEVTAIVRQL